MANERFNTEPPGWTTIEELKENLTYYLIENSSYSRLSGESMSEDMLKEMEATIEHMANAIYHEISNSSTELLWYLFKNNQPISIIGGENDRVNFINGNGINIESYITQYNSDPDNPKRSVNLKINSESSIVEAGRLENLSSNTVVVEFKKNFTGIPIGDEPRVYRLSELEPGSNRFRRENVLFYFTKTQWLDHLGFELEIDEYEDLSGVIVEYEFTQET